MKYIIDDIFEYLRNIVSCDYISDMQFGSYHETAVLILKEIKIERIKPDQHIDICLYLGI